MFLTKIPRDIRGSIPKDVKDGIKSVITNSDFVFNRIHITFKNGYALSVINGYGAYCGEDSYEIAIVNLENELDGSLLDEKDQSDDVVLGYCSPAKVAGYIIKVSKL